MKQPFQLSLLFAGTLLVLSPLIYKILTTVILALVIVKEHRADLNVGLVDPYLVLPLFSGIVMILIAIIFSIRTKSEGQ